MRFVPSRVYCCMWLLATFGRLSIELIRYDFRDDAQRGLRCHAKTARIFVITALKRAMKETHGAVVKGSEEAAASFDSARFLLREVVEASLILLQKFTMVLVDTTTRLLDPACTLSALIRDIKAVSRPNPSQHLSTAKRSTSE